jgi:acetyltransferase-like isoleucine patch superfamily enzyme
LEIKQILTSTKVMKRLAFQNYFFVENTFWLFCSILPPFLRAIIFKLVFGSFGSRTIVDYGCYVRYPWKVSLGHDSILNRGCRVYASFAVADAYVIIGNHVAFGPDVIICGAGHDYSDIALPDTAKTVTIEDHAWIGCRAIILPGVTVGKGSVVGAGSVVTKDVAPWTVVAGNPAVEIKRRVVVGAG